MPGITIIREGATSGYIVDASGILALIEETEHLASTVTNDNDCAHRQQYDLENQMARPFHSGWNDLPCDNPADS